MDKPSPPPQVRGLFSFLDRPLAATWPKGGVSDVFVSFSHILVALFSYCHTFSTHFGHSVGKFPHNPRHTGWASIITRCTETLTSQPRGGLQPGPKPSDLRPLQLCLRLRPPQHLPQQRVLSLEEHHLESGTAPGVLLPMKNFGASQAQKILRGIKQSFWIFLSMKLCGLRAHTHEMEPKHIRQESVGLCLV